jgi:hypothetical protein
MISCYLKKSIEKIWCGEVLRKMSSKQMFLECGKRYLVMCNAAFRVKVISPAMAKDFGLSGD